MGVIVISSWLSNGFKYLSFTYPHFDESFVLVFSVYTCWNVWGMTVPRKPQSILHKTSSAYVNLGSLNWDHSMDPMS